MSFVFPEEIIKNLALDEGMQVADFGAGSGTYSMLASKYVGSTGKVYAIDLNKELLSKIKNDSTKTGMSNVEVVWGDLETLGGSKLASKILDRIIISNLLFQVEDKESVVREAARLLKPNGLVLFIDWAGSYGGLGPKRENLIPKDKALKLFLNNSFTLVEEISAGDYHFGFIVKRL